MTKKIKIREIENSELSFQNDCHENKNKTITIPNMHADVCLIHKRHVIWMTNAKTIVKEENEEEEEEGEEEGKSCRQILIINYVSVLLPCLSEF